MNPKFKLPKTLIIITAAAFILRLALFLYLTLNFGEEKLYTSDSYFFYRTAKNLILGNGFSLDTTAPFSPQAHFPPVYPLLTAASLAINDSVIPLILAQIVLSSLIPLLVWGISGFLTDNSKIKFLAAGLSAFEPTAIAWSVLVLTEVTAVFFLLLSFYFFVKLFSEWRWRNSALSGLFLGLSVLIRPNAQFLIILGFLFLLGYGYRHRNGILNSRSFWKIGVVFALSYLIILSPWLARNYITFSSFNISATGLRNVYTSFPPSVLSLKTGESIGEIQDKLIADFAAKRGIMPDDIHKNPSHGKELAQEGFKIIVRNPAESIKVALIALNAFFTQDLYTDYLQRFNLLPRFQIDFSPSVVLVKEGPLKLAKLVIERAGFYAAIPLTGRIFWILINIFWIVGAIRAYNKGGQARVAGILMALLILYYASTSIIGGFADHGRFRYPASSFMFILASYALFFAVQSRESPNGNLKNLITNSYR